MAGVNPSLTTSAGVARGDATPADAVLQSQPVLAPTARSKPATTLVVGDAGAFLLGTTMEQVAHEFNVSVINRGDPDSGLFDDGGGTVSEEDGAFLPDHPDCATRHGRWFHAVEDLEPAVVLLVLT